MPDHHYRAARADDERGAVSGPEKLDAANVIDIWVALARLFRDSGADVGKTLSLTGTLDDGTTLTFDVSASTAPPAGAEIVLSVERGDQ